MKKIETSIKTWKSEAMWLRTRASELLALSDQVRGKRCIELKRIARLLGERADYIEHPRREVVT